MRLRELYEQTVKYLQNAGVSDAKTDARLLVCAKLGASWAQVLTQDTDADFSALLPDLKRRAAGEPLQYILGETEWMSLPFFVDENVLIPRQDTEVLAEFVIEHMQTVEKPRIADLCTGSGCLAICFAKFLPGADVVGYDKSGAALKVAQKNNVRNHTDVTFLQADLLTQDIEGVFDCIVSNPPYIETDEIARLQSEVRFYEPHPALDGGQDGLLFYRRLCPMAYAQLTAGGLFAVEIGCAQKDAVVSLFLQAGFVNVGTRKDYGGNDRVVFGQTPKE